MFCKECGAEIPDDSKHCSECGAKLINETKQMNNVESVEKESFFNKNKKWLIGCCVGLIVIFIIVAVLSVGSDSDNSEFHELASNMVDDANISEDEFKDKCDEINYNKLNKNPDSHKGERLKASGKIIQISEDDEGGWMRLAVDGDYSDVVFVSYTNSIDYVEDDYVTVYGYAYGEYTYTSTIGAEVSIPWIDGIYVDGA